MPRYFIFGNEKPKVIEQIVTRVLAEKGLKVHNRTHWDDNPYWDDFVGYSMYPKNTGMANSAGLMVDLRTRTRESIKQLLESHRTTKAAVNYEIAIAPAGYGSAVERGAEYRARQLDELANALLPELNKPEAYKSHGVGGTDFRRMRLRHKK